MNNAETNKVIYLIRHARSVYNQAEHEVQELYKDQEEGHSILQTPEYLKLKWDTSLLDCEIIQPEGKDQWQKCKQQMAKIDVDLIIVSPLRRALTTCALVFQNYHKKVPIIVDPLFREIFQSVCDIGSGLRKSMKDYPHFDYSLIENVDSWYVDCIKNEEARTRILDKLKNSQPSQLNKNAQELMLQYLQQLWERRKVDDALHKPEALSPVSIQKQKLKMLLQTYNSIAIVTHSQNIKSYTGIKPPNCSIMKYLDKYFDQPLDKIPHNFV